MTLTSRILAAHARFGRWGYAARRPAVPDRMPGVPPDLPTEPHLTDCTTYAAWVLLASHPALRRVEGLWSELAVWDGARPWSGIEALSALGYAEAMPQRSGWYWAQSWSGLRGGRVVPGASGHARLVEVTAGGLWVLEARATRSADGAGPGVVKRRVGPDAWRTWGEHVRAVRLG